MKAVKERWAKIEAGFQAYISSVQIRMVRFSIKDQTLFAKRLSFLVQAGVPLLEGLYLIRKQTKGGGKQKVYDLIIHDVSNGQFLSTALAKFRNIFGDFSINLIRVGEHAGVLSQNLLYLADELGKKHALQRKVRGALIYPMFIMVATLGVTGALTVFIFPKIMPIFASLDVTLPLTTRILLAVSTFLESWGFHTIGGLIVFVIAFMFARKSIPSVRYGSDYLLLKLPIAGQIAQSYNLANFCRTFGLLINSGVHTTEAMHITANVCNNVVYKQAYEEVAKHIVKGERISQNLEKFPKIFPDMLSHMILIGETTGSLSKTLFYLSDMYEAEVDESTKNLSNSIEPILLTTMGILVGLIAVSVISPIYEITKNLSPR